jgi:arylsulfatase A-like enzyme
MQESSYENRVQPRRLPEDAPNILFVLIDDAGPGLPDTFGGEVRTETLSKIHNEGVGFDRFHTTAMCSPTRASLLTGRAGVSERHPDHGRHAHQGPGGDGWP